MRLALSVLAILSGLSLALPAAAAPLYTVPPPSVEQIADAVERPVGGRLFALAVPLTLDSDSDGSWSESGDTRSWSAEILASGAHSLSLRFDRAVLPPGAELRVISHADPAKVQGPYTARQVREGGLWTALLFDERVILELTAPAASEPVLRLSAINYGFREPLGRQAKSGSCNIDVACPEANGFDDQVRSTVLIQFSQGPGTVACSGLLANNARRDLTPYILLADHCGLGAGNDHTAQIYWKFQRNQCVQPGAHGHNDPDPTFSITGAEWLAEGQDSDFTLIVPGSRDNPQVPPASYEPFWSGWDVRQTPAQQGVGVHHPTGNEKSISLFNDPAQSVTVDIDGRSTKAWRVVWDQGTTEQGSSGSGLWNEAGRAVGVLSGGEASCSNREGPDFYGRFNVAWTEENRCDRQLRFWLDPDLSGTEVADGTDGSNRSAEPVVPACDPNSPQPTPTPTSTPSPAPTGGGGGSSGSTGLGLLLLLLAAGRRRCHRGIMSAV